MLLACCLFCCCCCCFCSCSLFSCYCYGCCLLLLLAAAMHCFRFCSCWRDGHAGQGNMQWGWECPGSCTSAGLAVPVTVFTTNHHMHKVPSSLLHSYLCVAWRVFFLAAAASLVCSVCLLFCPGWCQDGYKAFRCVLGTRICVVNKTRTSRFINSCLLVQAMCECDLFGGRMSLLTISGLSSLAVCLSVFSVCLTVCVSVLKYIINYLIN